MMSENTVTSFSFKTGFEQLRIIDVPVVEKEIMNALGITHRTNFLKRLKGEVEPKVSEAKSIEAIFKQYGITKIWGDGHVNKSDQETTGGN